MTRGSRAVAGVGMVPFATPSKSADLRRAWPQGAVRAALADAGVDLTRVQQAYAGYVYGDSTCGQNGALRRRADRHPGGERQQQLLHRVLGAVPGPPGRRVRRRRLRARVRLRADAARRAGHAAGTTGPSPFARLRRGDREPTHGAERGPDGRRDYFGGAGAAYAERYGTKPETFATIAVKARRHAANNPYAVFRDPVTVEEVMASPHDLRPADPAAVLPAHLRRGRGRPRARRTFAAQARPAARTSRSRAQAMTTDTPSSFDGDDMRELVGYDMAQRCRPIRSTRQAGRRPGRTSRSSSCTTASPTTSCSPTRRWG